MKCSGKTKASLFSEAFSLVGTTAASSNPALADIEAIISFVYEI
jgi:hypothetical protein